MKKLLGFVFVIFVVFGCKTDNTKNNRLITEKIQYDVSVKNTDPEMGWWIHNIEGPKRDKFINLIFEAIKDNKLKVFDLNENATTLETVLSNLFTFDTVQLQKNNKKKQIIDTVFISNSFDLKNITKFRFREKWLFNEKTLMVEKQVNGYCPVLVIGNDEKEPPHSLPLFWIFSDTTQKSDESNLIQITPKIQYEVIVKSDIVKDEWFIDNIEPTDRDYFINKIIEVASKGKLKVYDFFGNLINKDSFKKLLHKTDTILVQNVDDPEVFEEQIVKTDLDSKSITKVRFIEEWKIDKTTFKFYKLVKAISLLQEVKDEKGIIRGYTPIFWIYFDESIMNTAAN